MQNVEEQKIKLEQKKNRLIQEENRLKIKERKVRTRHLIEIGGLIVKAELGFLPTNTLYGGLLSLKHDLNQNSSVKDKWTKLGKAAFDQEQKEKIAVILSLVEKPTLEVRSNIRTHGLKWNKLREEWYGYVTDQDSLKKILQNIKHNLEIIEEVPNN